MMAFDLKPLMTQGLVETESPLVVIAIGFGIMMFSILLYWISTKLSGDDLFISFDDFEISYKWMAFFIAIALMIIGAFVVLVGVFGTRHLP